MRRIVLGFLISTVCGMQAQAESASSYQNSCNRIQVIGSTLTASCRRMDGSFSNASILIRGIHNNNGVLQFGGMGQASSFQNSCRNIEVVGSTLSANCRRMDGGFNRTTILIRGIHNNNGVLVYQ